MKTAPHPTLPFTLYFDEDADRVNAWVLRRAGRGVVNEGFEIFIKKEEEK